MIRLLIAFLMVVAVAVLPARAADDERMDKADLPGAKSKGAVKPLPSKLPGPSPQETPAETTPAEAPLAAPSQEVCKRLVTATLLSFNRAVQSKSFTAFHIESLSKPFADAYPAEKLLETFQPFIAAGANLGGVEAVDPEFETLPAVENNLLKLKGVYRTRPMLVLFDFDYANDAGTWKVNAMTVNLKGTPPPMKTAGPTTPGGAAAPSEADLSKLVTETILDFNTAIQSGGAFEPLLAKASQSMKWQIKPQQLREAFATFIQNRTDLSAVASAQPQFDGPPTIEGKHMTVSGHYRVLPMFVLFNAEYMREGNQWKLLGLSVNTIAPAAYKRDAAIRGDAPTEDQKPPAARPAEKKLPPVPGAGDGVGAEEMKGKDEMRKEK